MIKLLSPLVTLGALLCAPMGAQAVVYTFNAALNSANEVAAGVASAATATGIATLSYDTMGTASPADDTYSFAMSVFGLSGAATGFHIHGAATATETASVRVNLALAPFVNLNLGGNLLVGGSGVSPVAIPATPASLSNAGHLAMSFLDMLRSDLAYVNVHTALNPSGAVRGQLIEVSVVPEPSTYAMLLAGVGVLGWSLRRQRRGRR